MHEGSLFGVIVAFRDISERRRFEEENRKLQKMNALVLMATGLGRELAEAQRRIDESVNELIARAEGDSARLFRRIIGGCAQQQAVILQLIGLGRTDLPEPDLVSPNSLLATMRPKLKRALGPGRTLLLNPGPDISPIRIDAQGFRDCLLGLIAKARLAMPEGGAVEISTASSTMPDGKEGVRIEVRDNGEPVPASARLFVFDPYYHSRRRDPSSGLALTVIYRFVMLSGGQIDIVSAPGQGTCCRLDFPAARPVSGEALTKYQAVGSA